MVASSRCQWVTNPDSRDKLLLNFCDRVDAQWITARKDWQDAKKRHKKQQEQKQNGVKHASVDDAHDGAESVYEKNMDAMRCILYLHGGVFDPF